jgi:opacity protein-like surface antigen
MKTCIKSLFVIILILIIFSPYSSAQRKGQISVMGGYQMLGGIEAVYGEADINDATAYSGTIAYFLRPDVAIEFQYIYQPTQLSYDPYNANPERVLFDLDMHYLLIGASYHRDFNPKVSGFGGLSAGAVLFSPSKDYEPKWKFAFAATAGIKVLISKNVGLRLQVQGLFPVQWTSTSFYIGTGGVDFGVSAGTTAIQIATSGGLFFAF